MAGVQPDIGMNRIRGNGITGTGRTYASRGEFVIATGELLLSSPRLQPSRREAAAGYAA